MLALQVFLQAKLTGVDRFIAEAGEDFEARVRWSALLVEVLPRALLAELGLSPLLLGTSGGDQFLVVIPAEAREQADRFLAGVQRELWTLGSGGLRLAWSSTENLGDWSDVRKRLFGELRSRIATPADSRDLFEPFAPTTAEPAPILLERAPLREARSVGWSPESPATIVVPEGKHRWSIAGDSQGIAYPRHEALEEDNSPASLSTLAERSAGRKSWGVLLGDVDNFEARLRRAQTVEEHLQLSLMYKQFFAGELQMLCSMPEFFRRVTLLSSGGNDFAVYGSWDALIPFARELQRLFARFVEANVRELAGNDGKTITMAMALSGGAEDTLSSVYRRAAENLASAKAAGKDSFYLLGRTLEWKQVGEAADTKATMTRMVSDFGCSPQFLFELGSFYRGSGTDFRRGRARNDRLERPWRFHRRLNRVIAGSVAASRSKEFQRVRSELIADFTGRNAAQIRLRPSGRVALEWARLETEASNGRD